jgi:hypothetical protein
MPSDLKKLFRELKSDINRIERAYIRKFLKTPLATPEKYELSVKAYCVLCHAAFEQFAEEVANIVLTQVVEDYKNNQKVSLAIVNLLHFMTSGTGSLGKDEYRSAPLVIYDYIRVTLEKVKGTLSNFINGDNGNNGIGVKNLNKLFVPLGIEVPRDPSLLNSLKLLSNERGHYAHKRKDGGVIRHSLAPEDARKVVTDCIEIFKQIKDEALKLV